MRTRIKIWGITRAQDGRAAIAAGADALGMIFWPPSRRNVALATAQEIAALPGLFCERIGVFVEPEKEFVWEVLDRVRLTMLQFHGNEAADFCRGFGLPYLKALRMRESVDVGAAVQNYADARGLLLDSYVPGQPGGTGETFAWEQLRKKRPSAHEPDMPFVLAGGLNPENVATAITVAAPYAVDVSGGVEDAPGIKNRRRIEAFCAAVRAADDDRCQQTISTSY